MYWGMEMEVYMIWSLEEIAGPHAWYLSLILGSWFNTVLALVSDEVQWLHFLICKWI